LHEAILPPAGQSGRAILVICCAFLSSSIGRNSKL
jgi:hypothetical protein